MPVKPRRTDIGDFIESLNAGVFKDKIDHVLSEVALYTSEYGDNRKKGIVEIKFTFGRMGEGDQMLISHKITKSMPTKGGKATEEDTTESAMYMGPGGKLTIEQPPVNHQNQGGLELVFDKED